MQACKIAIANIHTPRSGWTRTNAIFLLEEIKAKNYHRNTKFGKETYNGLFNS